jgi:hypothetical protein
MTRRGHQGKPRHDDASVFRPLKAKSMLIGGIQQRPASVIRTKRCRATGCRSNVFDMLEDSRTGETVDLPQAPVALGNGQIVPSL